MSSKREKPIRISDVLWLDPLIDWPSLGKYAVYILLFVAFEWGLDLYGLYRPVAKLCQIFTFYLFWCAIAEQFELNLNGISLLACKDRLEVSGGKNVTLPFGSIISITALPEFETRHVKSVIGMMVGEGTGSWNGWTAIMDLRKTKVSVLAIESTGDRILVQCKTPEKAIAKLNVVMGRAMA